MATTQTQTDRTQSTLTETDFGQKALNVGDHVVDRKDGVDATMLVVAVSPKTAEDWRIDVDTTVADVNPDYPETDKVVEVIFPNEGDLDINEKKRYAYPRSRLRRATGVHG